VDAHTDGSDFKGERLTVQFARGPRHKETFNGPSDRPSAPRPRRTVFRMQVSGLPTETSWQVSSHSCMTDLSPICYRLRSLIAIS
jgi:hypothetical protein